MHAREAVVSFLQQVFTNSFWELQDLTSSENATRRVIHQASDAYDSSVLKRILDFIFLASSPYKCSIC